MERLLKFIRRPFVAVVGGGLLIFAIVLNLQKGASLEFLELGAYDWFVRLEPKLVREDQRITLIEITEKDILAIGRWPLSDQTLAAAMRVLLKDGPCAIGLDIYRDILVPPGSSELKRIFADNPMIIGVNTFGEKGVRPPAIVSNPNQVGFNDILVDPGGIVRRGLFFLDDGNEAYESFSLRLASLYLQTKGMGLEADPVNPSFVRLNSTTIRPFESDDGGYVRADARGYQFFLDFEDAGVPFRSYSLSALLAGEVPSEAVKNRVILIGVSAQSVKDYFYTPLSRGFEEAQQVSGVELHGLIVSQILRYALNGAAQIRTFAGRWEIAWLLAWSLAGGLVGFRTRSLFRFSFMLIAGLSVLFSVAYLAFACRWWIPFVPPAFSFFLAATVVTALTSSREKKERALLMQLFSRHVSREIAEEIWEQREQFMNNGRPRSRKMDVTVFFLDLKGFTSVSEKLDPETLIDWLNSYMEALTRLIMVNGGVIDDYAGDGIKANFGVPLPRSREEEIRADAENAVSCALDIEQEMYRLNSLWTPRGFPAMGTRIGIFTGTVVAGLLGSSDRLKYTTVGDTVNVAARLESFDKEVGKDAICRILIGDTTRRLLGDRFRAVSIGDVALKGKENRIAVYRILSEQEHVTQAPLQEVTT